ncbi:MAG: hypothetical protein HPZ91_00800 [Lentisphaeria bacterium]|nr:hypothetical protein [Lentisphaeria bacterium]
MKSKPMLIAHRGLSATYPENTLIAFDRALELDIDAMEFDVHMTVDGELVVTHDDTVDRCSNGTGPVRDFTFAELRKLDFGAWKGPEFAGTRIPTLNEVLDLVERKRPELYLCVELKEDDCECARKVIEELDRRGRLGNCSIISFKSNMLFYVKGLSEKAFLHGFIGESELDAPEKREYLKIVRRVGIWREKVSAEFSRKLHALGIEVDSWAADNEEELQRMLDGDVDTVTSNAPDRIIHRFR